MSSLKMKMRFDNLLSSYELRSRSRSHAPRGNVRSVRSAEMSGANFSTMLNRFIKSGISALRIRTHSVRAAFPRGAWKREKWKWDLTIFYHLIKAVKSHF